MKLRPKRPARENAARLLPRLANVFFSAGDEAFEEELRGAELHDFRIRAKRFRYVLEYFRPCYGRALDAYLELVRGLQSALGDLNDCAATRALLMTLLPQGQGPSRLKRLFSALDRREEDLYQDYRTFWINRMQDSGDRKQFLRYLSHPPRRRTRPPAHRPARRAGPRRRARPPKTKARGADVALPLSGAAS